MYNFNYKRCFLFGCLFGFSFDLFRLLPEIGDIDLSSVFPSSSIIVFCGDIDSVAFSILFGVDISGDSAPTGGGGPSIFSEDIISDGICDAGLGGGGPSIFSDFIVSEDSRGNGMETVTSDGMIVDFMIGILISNSSFFPLSDGFGMVSLDVSDDVYYGNKYIYQFGIFKQTFSSSCFMSRLTVL